MSEQSTAPFHTEGIITNPLTAGVLLATSGLLAEGVHTFSLIAGCTVAARINLVWRKADTTIKHNQPIFLVASNAFQHDHPAGLSIVCEQDDTFTLETATAIVGSVQGSLCVA